MTLTPHIYLSFDGRCEEAFRFYERCLGGRIVSSFPYGNSPMASTAPPGWTDKWMHATLTVGNTIIAGSDVAPDQYERPRGFTVNISVTEPEEAERVFHALAENADVKMPIQETFWSIRFGTLVDQFGVPWSINCEQMPATA